MSLEPRFDAPLPRIPCLARVAGRLPCLQLDSSACDLVTDSTCLLRFSAHRLQVWRGNKKKTWIWSLDPRVKRPEFDQMSGRIHSGKAGKISASLVPFALHLSLRLSVVFMADFVRSLGRCHMHIYRCPLVWLLLLTIFVAVQPFKPL